LLQAWETQRGRLRGTRVLHVSSPRLL
jgi:hypothetical protein